MQKSINYYYGQIQKHKNFKKELKLIKLKAVLLTVLTVLSVIALDVLLVVNFGGV